MVTVKQVFYFFSSMSHVFKTLWSILKSTKESPVKEKWNEEKKRESFENNLKNLFYSFLKYFQPERGREEAGKNV